jgi:hypothetical protein
MNVDFNYMENIDLPLIDAIPATLVLGNMHAEDAIGWTNQPFTDVLDALIRGLSPKEQSGHSFEDQLRKIKLVLKDPRDGTVVVNWSSKISALIAKSQKEYETFKENDEKMKNLIKIQTSERTNQQ